MPLKRRAAKNRSLITPAAVEAFKVEDWMALHRALGLKPWHVSPLDAVGPCPYRDDGSAGAEFWPLARLLRAQLAAAVGDEPCQ